ncbi:MAG: hypothetical protein M1834_000180 [Cirrosporium novae-zelandiae]|nr:MAG: hypothetical protein M1834_000180 [Cirrosporium novae-zelandiae]
MSALSINYGMVLFPGFQALDVFGPLDALNLLSSKAQVKLSLIAHSKDPVSTMPPSDIHRNPTNSSCSQSIIPTHTFKNAPPLDVLIVPGGLGTRVEENIKPIVDFVKQRYPELSYLISVCTGAGILAKAGILDGRRATTNKMAFEEIKSWRTEVKWVPAARWVVDGNIYTAAGISAGIDTTLAFIQNIYGEALAEKIANEMEYDRHIDPSWDPFSKKLGLV